MTAIDRLLAGAFPPGVYRAADPASAPEIMQRVAQRGWVGWNLPGHLIRDKETFLDLCARAMSFPTYFGRNWDAFEECITDLSWASSTGYLLLYDHPAPFAQNQPDQWQIALAILHEAISYWQQRETPFFVLLRKTHGVAPETPFLSRR